MDFYEVRDLLSKGAEIENDRLIFNPVYDPPAVPPFTFIHLAEYNGKIGYIGYGHSCRETFVGTIYERRAQDIIDITKYFRAELITHQGIKDPVFNTTCMPNGTTIYGVSYKSLFSKDYFLLEVRNPKVENFKERLSAAVAALNEIEKETNLKRTRMFESKRGFIILLSSTWGFSSPLFSAFLFYIKAAGVPDGSLNTVDVPKRKDKILFMLRNRKALFKIPSTNGGFGGFGIQQYFSEVGLYDSENSKALKRALIEVAKKKGFTL